MPRFITNLWFDTNAHEAAEYYCSVFPNSEITRVAHYTEAGPGEAGTVMTIDFSLDGKPFTAINGGPQFTFSEAVSLLIDCADQAEVDHYWNNAHRGRRAWPVWLAQGSLRVLLAGLPRRVGRAAQRPRPRARRASLQRDAHDGQDRHRSGEDRRRRLSASSIAMAPRISELSATCASSCSPPNDSVAP